MSLILFLAFVGLLIYAINISSRLKRLESRLLQPTPFQPAITPTKTVTQEAPVNRLENIATPSEPFDSQTFINMLPKVGIVALVIGLGFFLKYAIDEGWISVSLRLIIGGALGTLFLALFYFWKDKYENYSLALAGGGLAIWYLTIWAAVQLYGSIGSNTGLMILAIVSLMGVLLAYKTNSKAMAALSWGGAYLIPIILTIGSGQYGLLLTYLTIVSTALLVSILYNNALYFFLLALFGSLINVLWVSMERGIPNGDYFYTILYLLVNLFIFSIILVLSIRKEAEKKDSNLLHGNEFALIAGIVFGILILPIMAISYNQYRDLAPLLMTVVAVWMFVVYGLVDRLEYKNINYILSGLGIISLTFAALWYFGQTPQIIALYVLGLISIVVGRTQNRPELRIWGLLILLGGIFASCLISYNQVDALFISKKFGLEILGLASLVAGYFLIKKDGLSEFENTTHTAIEYMVAVLVWLFVTWDLFHYFNAFGEINQRNLSLSIWWIIYALVLIGFSSVASAKPLKKLGLLLIGLSILKVFLYDVQSLDTVYRIISFITLGAILLGFSFIYQHNKERIKEYLN